VRETAFNVKESDQISSTSRALPACPAPCTEPQETERTSATAEAAAAVLEPQVALVPLSSSVEECVGSNDGNENSKQKFENHFQELSENEKSFISATTYHAEVYSDSKETSRCRGYKPFSLRTSKLECWCFERTFFLV
jgi:hypothetical protein